MSLADFSAHAALPVEDLARARTFYEDVLGLKPGPETTGGVFMNAGGGSRILIFISQGSSAGSHTQAAWDVADIEAEPKERHWSEVIARR